MTYSRRTLEERLTEASSQFPVLLLTGPRQVGKTTLLTHLAEANRRIVTLDDPILRGLANDDPALFLQRFTPPLLIDEVQYAPGLLSHIKMAVDQSKQPGAFWLTGSQQFHLMQGVSETLAGRVAIINLLGFSRREAEGQGIDRPPFLPGRDAPPESTSAGIQEVFERIWLGSFPALVTGQVSDRDLFYSSYVQTYLQRDVRDLAQVGNQQAFVRFLRACAARTGQLLNLSNLARDVDVSVPTARNWLSILEASFQVFLLRPYYNNVTKRLVKTPKLYFLDTGLCAYLTEWSSPETLAAGAMSGAIFETHVVVEILKSWWHQMRSPRLYFYRDRDGREVDLLFAQDGTLFPIEIKLGASPKSSWVRAFRAIDRFPEKRGEGAVVSLVKQSVPLSRQDTALSIDTI